MFNEFTGHPGSYDVNDPPPLSCFILKKTISSSGEVVVHACSNPSHARVISDSSEAQSEKCPHNVGARHTAKTLPFEGNPLTRASKISHFSRRFHTSLKLWVQILWENPVKRHTCSLHLVRLSSDFVIDPIKNQTRNVRLFLAPGKSPSSVSLSVTLN